MKTKVLFCFDSEDYTDAYSTDMLPRLADVLGRNGVCGHFMIVGLLAEAIEKQNRTDVIDAMKAHSVGFHTYGHTLHPTVAEYTDVESFEEAQRRLMAEETAAETVKRVFGVDTLCAAVPPGSSITYAAMYRYAQIGIPVYADSPLKEAEEPVWFCNQLHIPYNYALEEYLFYPNFYVDKFLDYIAEKKQVTLYNHPNMICHSEFWDGVNYKRTNQVEFGKWNSCPTRTEEEVERFFRHLEILIHALQADERFEITSIPAILKETDRERVISRADAMRIREALGENTLMPFSRAELTAAAKAFLEDPGLTEYRPEPVYGFLAEPRGCTEEITVTEEVLREAAKELVPGQFLPEVLTADGTEIGPMDWLTAAWEILAGADSARIEPKQQTEVPAEFEHLRKMNLRGSWMHAEDFLDTYLSDRLRLQAWTMHK